MSDLLIVNAHAVDAAAGLDGPRDLLILLNPRLIGSRI